MMPITNIATTTFLPLIHDFSFDSDPVSDINAASRFFTWEPILMIQAADACWSADGNWTVVHSLPH